MALKDYFQNSINSTFREKIFEYRLCYDFKISAAKNNFDVQIHKPEIDSRGYDIILDDRISTRLIQLKISHKITTKTTFKDIHQSLILPKPNDAELRNIIFGDIHPRLIGDNGALLASSYNIQNDSIENITYYYTDLIVIFLFSLGVISKFTSSQQKATDIINQLGNFNNLERINITSNLIIKVKSIDDLFPLLGIENGSANNQSWLYNAFLFDCEHNKETYPTTIELIKLITDDIDLKYGIDKTLI